MKTRTSSDNLRCISEEHFMVLPEDIPPPISKDILILTKYGKLLIGKWGNDCVAWMPLPSSPKTLNK